LRKSSRSDAQKTRAKLVGDVLDELYPAPGVPLDHTDPFTLLVAVLLSAQTTDKRVNLVTPALFARASTPETMAALSVSEIQKLIQTCGLAPQKAKALQRLSQILVEKYSSRVPQTFEDLESLPGVGHKTASVVMAQAFGIPAFPVDTHIHRLAQRWEFTKGKNVAQTERDLKAVFPEALWNKRHIQIILYGREFCTARGCDGTQCRICQLLHPDRKRPKRVRKA
jgi:endonuclease-3